MDSATQQVLVIGITTLGTVTVAWIKAHPAPPKEEDEDEGS